MRVIALVQPFLIFLVRLRHRGQFERGQCGEAADIVRRDLVRGNANVDPVAVVRVGELCGEPGGEFERMRRAVERRDRHPRDALDHQALVEHGPQRFEGRRRRGQESLRRFGPELVHDHAVRHVHEAETHRRLVGLVAGFRPSHGFQQRQRKRGSEAFEARAAIEKEVSWHWWWCGVLNAAVQEGITGDDFGDERLHAVLIACEVSIEAIHNDLVVALELAAQRIGQKFLGEVPGKFILARGDDALQFLGR